MHKLLLIRKKLAGVEQDIHQEIRSIVKEQNNERCLDYFMNTAIRYGITHESTKNITFGPVSETIQHHDKYGAVIITEYCYYIVIQPKKDECICSLLR